MNYILKVFHNDDLYEISLNGYIIARITHYTNGLQRQEVEYDDLPEQVKEKILDKVQKELNHETN